ncbi:hypothetical protein R1flu_016915 [Riccia fluitans]|uniref:Uncharacterized protein n=1 Tax=Riccia fluitans TaxID=41844 RepID=A0ABD1YRA5_9MARC
MIEDGIDNLPLPRMTPPPLLWIQPRDQYSSIEDNLSCIQTIVPPSDRLALHADSVVDSPSARISQTANRPQSPIISRVNEDPPRGQNRKLKGSSASSTI